MALRAWEAEVLGRLCAFISSFFFSAWRFSSAARLPARGLASSSRSKILRDGETAVKQLNGLKRAKGGVVALYTLHSFGVYSG